ncbi:hypothetical protein JL720_309 [Aureococcus anophagefferens]|nr:hypothetical protein JL720_309 [Aureococcus anophagefferens]
MCSWDLCSQACYGRKPSDDDSEKVSHYVLLVAMFALTVPCCHVFGWLFEEYLIAPVPPAILECLGYEVEEPNFAPVEKDWDPRERKALEDRSPEEASDDTITSVKIQFDATHEAGDGAGVGGAPPAPDADAATAALNKEDDGEDEDAIDWVGDLATSLEAANGAWLNRDKVRTPGKSPGRSAGRAMRRSITASKSVMKRSMSAGASSSRAAATRTSTRCAARRDAVARCAELSYYATKADQSTRKDARRAASLLRARKDELMGTWGWVPGDASGFEAAVRARKQLTRAREWDEELNEAEDAAAKEHCFAGHVWLLQCAFALALYIAVMKPLVVGIYYVLIPSLVLTKVQSSLAIFDDGGDAVPYATLVPSSAAYYLLAMHRSSGTRAGARVLGGDGAAKRPTVDDVIDGLHDSDRRASHVAQDVMLVWVAFFFSFSEDIQDTIVEEVVAFFPAFVGPIVSSLQKSGARRGGASEAVGMILVVFFCVVVYCVIMGLASRGCRGAAT